jgi:ATP-dependent helicase/nuclease subunit B
MIPHLLQGTDPLALGDAVLRDCVAALQAERQRGRAGTVLWIAPTLRAQKQWTRRLIATLGQPCLAPPIVTFEGFAERLLHAAGRPATAISPTVRRLLLRRITKQLAQEGRLSHFGGVAETAGFLDVVSGFISELKRDEIWPEDFDTVCQRTPHAQSHRRDEELGLIYGRYQRVLLEQNWYDHEGRFWLARTELAEGRCRQLPDWSWIAVAGFTDFTRTQTEILEHLALRTAALVITLPNAADDPRRQLFEKSQASATVFHQLWPNLTSQRVATTHAETRDRAQLRTALFGNPRQITPLAERAETDIIATTGAESEITAVALKLKDWLRAGHRPAEMAVGLRSLSEDGWRWSNGLRAAGLPVWCETGVPLASTGVVKFLLSMLQCELEQWPFARLSAVLGSSYLRPRQAPGSFENGPRMVRRAVRALRLPDGRRDILAAVSQAEVRSQRLPIEKRSSVDYSIAHQWLQWYAQLTDGLSRSRTLSDWIDQSAELLTRCGVFDSAAVEIETADLASWDQAQRLLRAAAAAEATWQAEPRRLSLAEYLQELRDLLANERCEPALEPAGAIRLLGLDQLRHLETPYLIVAGLTEESFPRRRGDDCLFTDAERRRLAELGLPIRHAVLHQQEELLFFYHVVLSATRQLVLTYPEVNAKGQPAFSSPYVAALRSLWTKAALSIRTCGQLDPVPDAENAVSATDARYLAMRAAIDGDAGWLRSLWETPATRGMVHGLVAAVEMDVHRFHTAGFTAYEGRLDLEPNRRELARRFAANRQFSATELELFAACPFRYWVAKVLDIEPLADVETGTDTLRRGVLVHDVLSQLIDEMRPSTAQAALIHEFRTRVTEALDREIADSDLQKALVRIERQVLDEWGTAYAQQFHEYATGMLEAWGTPWTSIPPEVPFGSVPQRPEETVRPPLEVGTGDEKVLICGRIDRVDTGRVDGEPVFTVIDYKTGRRPSFRQDDVAAGRALQLVLYAVAARRLGLVPADAAPFQLGYWCIRETGFKGELGKRGAKMQALDAAVWSAVEEMVDLAIPRLVGEIRSGAFVVDNPDKDCTGHCDYHTVCRVQQLRPVAEKLVKLRFSESTGGE